LSWEKKRASRQGGSVRNRQGLLKGYFLPNDAQPWSETMAPDIIMTLEKQNR
jgi:hypothetical protein